MGSVCVSMLKWSYAIGGNMVTRKQDSEKRSLIPWRLRVLI